MTMGDVAVTLTVGKEEKRTENDFHDQNSHQSNQQKCVIIINTVWCWVGVEIFIHLLEDVGNISLLI